MYLHSVTSYRIVHRIIKNLRAFFTTHLFRHGTHIGFSLRPPPCHSRSIPDRISANDDPICTDADYPLNDVQFSVICRFIILYCAYISTSQYCYHRPRGLRSSCFVPTTIIILIIIFYYNIILIIIVLYNRGSDRRPIGDRQPRRTNSAVRVLWPRQTHISDHRLRRRVIIIIIIIYHNILERSHGPRTINRRRSAGRHIINIVFQRLCKRS